MNVMRPYITVTSCVITQKEVSNAIVTMDLNTIQHRCHVYKHQVLTSLLLRHAARFDERMNIFIVTPFFSCSFRAEKC